MGYTPLNKHWCHNRFNISPFGVRNAVTPQWWHAKPYSCLLCILFGIPFQYFFQTSKQHLLFLCVCLHGLCIMGDLASCVTWSENTVLIVLGCWMEDLSVPQQWRKVILRDFFVLSILCPSVLLLPPPSNISSHVSNYLSVSSVLSSFLYIVLPIYPPYSHSVSSFPSLSSPTHVSCSLPAHFLSLFLPFTFPSWPTEDCAPDLH